MGIDTFADLGSERGLLADLAADPFPSRARRLGAGVHDLSEPGSHLGFLRDGRATLIGPAGPMVLGAGMYFRVPDRLQITVDDGDLLLISRLGERASLLVGGPISVPGRLRYIDGCTDSLLVPPDLAGEACLNLLHIPAHTAQSRHRHPSHRLGWILAGSGVCVTDEMRTPLQPGQPFLIRTNGFHSFHTEEQDLLVLAYHPDSDCGPTHEDHPMLNRTWDVGG